MMKKSVFLMLAVILIFCISAAAPAEEAGFRPGDWAFNHAPENSVLLLREDGTAVWQGKAFSWRDEDSFLLLTAEGGEQVTLRYSVDAEKTMIYLPTEYVREESVPGEGLIGAWAGKENPGSTFIFREADHMFLEDGTFVGTFRTDPETGTVLLVYPKYFDDTLCYYSLEGNDVLKLEYPWPLVETQKTP